MIFSYIRRLGSFFWVQNFEFQYFFWFFRKINIFWGMKILWIFFWCHHKIELYLGVISIHLGTVSGSGTGPLDYGATGPVPDPEPRL